MPNIQFSYLFYSCCWLTIFAVFNCAIFHFQEFLCSKCVDNDDSKANDDEAKYALQQLHFGVEFKWLVSFYTAEMH